MFLPQRDTHEGASEAETAVLLTRTVDVTRFAGERAAEMRAMAQFTRKRGTGPRAVCATV